MSLPVTITLGTLISLLGAAGHVIYGTIDFTSSGIDGVNEGNSMSKKLIDRCSEMIKDFEQIDKKILITGRGARIIQEVVCSLDWAQKYDRKMKITKLLFNNSYKKKFMMCHIKLTIYYNELVASKFLTKYFPYKNEEINENSTDLFHRTGFIDISNHESDNKIKRRFSFHV